MVAASPDCPGKAGAFVFDLASVSRASGSSRALQSRIEWNTAFAASPAICIPDSWHEDFSDEVCGASHARARQKALHAGVSNSTSVSATTMEFFANGKAPGKKAMS